MNSITFVDSRRPPVVAAGRLVVHVGDDRHPIRSQPVWPIADVLGVEDQMDDWLDGNALAIHDLLESRMIAPPRPRRRRQRAVSSRAVFYQGPDRQAD